MNPRKLFMSACMLVIMSASVAYAGFAPLNPAFVEWQKEQSEKKYSEVPNVSASSLSSNSASSHTKGYTPGPVNLTHLYANPPRVSAAETIPASYDLVELGRDTPVRDQDWLGTCWAFGSIVPVESNYLTHLVNDDGMVNGAWGDSESLNLSELHVAWYVKNNPDKTKVTLARRNEKSVKILNSGVVSDTIAYLARLDGSVPEYNLPYIDSIALSKSIGLSPRTLRELERANELPSYTAFNLMGYLNTGKWILPSPDIYPEYYADTYLPLIRLTDALFASPWPTIGQTRPDNDFENNELAHPDVSYVKELVMKHGAVCIAYWAGDDDDKELNTLTGAYRTKVADKTRSTNHMVSIVGWDDNYPAANFKAANRPANPGAWLVKNSWGKYWPNESADLNIHGGGYFWMSYEQPFEDGTAFVVQDQTGIINSYEYDQAGWCSAYGEGSTKIYAANAFKVRSEGEYLESISFYTTDNNATVNWRIYTGITDRPTDRPYPESASAAAYDSMTFPYAGYHTVFLDNQIPLNAGEYFTVVIEITNQSYQYPLAVEHKIESYTDWAVVHDYESWISLNGTDWKDGVDTIITKDDRKLNTPMNACIKAFTVYNDNLSNRNTVSNDETFIIRKPLNEKPYIDIDVSDENKMRSLPVWKATLTIYASTDTEVKTDEGTEVTFYLENTTEDEEFLLSYADDSTTNHPLGLGKFSDELEYDPLFEPGFEPDEFWQTYGNVEHPVYGPFTTTMEENQKIYIAVDDLEYVSGTRGLIPAGYYTLVYSIANSDTNGSVNLILMEADTSEQGEGDSEPEPAAKKTPSSSGGGCNVLTAAFATALLAFVPAIRKNKR